MIITYYCTNKDCGEKKYFSRKADSNPICAVCKSEMKEKDVESIDSIDMTSSESAFIADEALFNTIGNRVGKKANTGVTGA